MARWHSCNVLQVGLDGRRVWQFDAQKFQLNREQVTRDGEPLPSNLVGKSWGTLLQPTLNVAWLPPENVFLRVAQFPGSAPDELRSMVELQLEKLSPIPVTQAMWTIHALPSAADSKMQTVVVIIVSRNAVEEFLGKLETQGFMADRLELPLLDQLQGTKISEDGAWIFPEAQGGKNTALVAWWYGGVLQNVDLLTLPDGANRAASLREQLTQMAWAGELEGWLTAPPRWHLVANEVTAAEWNEPLRQGLEQEIEVGAPLPQLELAARTAQRAVQAEPGPDLLPPEFARRYQQQFVDRLWMRGLLAALALYGVGLAIYFIALSVLNFQTRGVEKQVALLGPAYTNAIQLRAKVGILGEQEALKFAALDCYEAVAELLPSSLALDSMNFTDGQRLTLTGTAPADQVNAVTDFAEALRNAEVNGKPVFDPASSAPPHTQLMGAGMVRWSYELDLNARAGAKGKVK